VKGKLLLKQIENPAVKAGGLAQGKKKALHDKYIYIGLLFALPWLIGFVTFQLYPIISAIYHSFTEYNVFSAPKWLGLANYKELFADKSVSKAFGNTLYMAFIGLPIGLFVALMVALLLNSKVVGLSLFRTIYYLPSVVPIVAAASVFIWILNPEFGLLAGVLRPLGITLPSFVYNPGWTKPGLIIMDTWRCGQAAIIYLAALQSVPIQFYEASKLDGSNAFQRFFYITLPSISPTILFLFVTGMINTFQYFTQGFVFASVTNATQRQTGGPANSLLFYSTYLYNNAFSYLRFGYASALAIVLLVVIIVTTLFTFRITHRSINYNME
jgi:multiple sugar transport system permease protein